jgi:hypothetical protein
MQKLASKHENVVKYIGGATSKGDGSRPTEFLILTELCPGMPNRVLDTYT